MANLIKNIASFHYSKRFSVINFFYFILFLLPSIFYGLAVDFKNFLYGKGLLKETELTKAKVICIGNLTTGGVGKTPVVIEFAKFLSRYAKVSVLTRGYKGKLKGTNVVRDFDKILINDVSLTGDEANLIANASENFALITSSDRLAGAKKAESMGAEVIIMDDGFSNRKIKKDLTLLLFDLEKFVGNGFLLPLGPLRESLKEIKRADGIILVDKGGAKDEIFNSLKNSIERTFKKPVFKVKFSNDYISDILTGEKITPEASHTVAAFCAIGQPEQFYNNLKGLNLKETFTFEDHHGYNKKDIKKLKKSACDYLITTEKDAVKLKELDLEGLKICALKLKAEIDAEEILREFKF